MCSKRKNQSDSNKSFKKSKKNNNDQVNENSESQNNSIRSSGSRSHSQALNNISNTLESLPNGQRITPSSSFNTSSNESNETIVAKIINNGVNGIFEKKKFKFGGTEKLYSPIYNFFQFNQMDKKPDGFIYPKCLLCNKAPKVLFGKLENLIHHLKIKTPEHDRFKTWLPYYKASSSSDLGNFKS